MWLLEKRVILMQLKGDYSEAVFNDQIQALKALIKQGTTPMYLIVDTTGATTTPKSLREPLSLLMANQLEGQIAWVMLVTANPYFRFLGNIAGNLTNVHFRPVTSLAEAVEVLLRVNPELEALHTVDLTSYSLSTPS